VAATTYTLDSVPYCTSNGLGKLLARVVEEGAMEPTPMANAPPKSLRMTQGHGSRVWSITILEVLWEAGAVGKRRDVVEQRGRWR
jgi:hypothetical protein